ncbi:hypothetical protein RFI_28307 [Reticulomyxa filosa]|uniref:Uncharacterized protein n=1 Tax=Reticulomyxa filosa TaxID=46433 RepID=X6M7S2_RETFI|nr:hypothetical protein RFI_28307 [Reticulomyxa filosa]|eukprot:ETO09080.1 hypothetical protein RFI_28307 [Reticulomyxa filosa]
MIMQHISQPVISNFRSCLPFFTSNFFLKNETTFFKKKTKRTKTPNHNKKNFIVFVSYYLESKTLCKKGLMHLDILILLVPIYAIHESKKQKLNSPSPPFWEQNRNSNFLYLISLTNELEKFDMLFVVFVIKLQTMQWNFVVRNMKLKIAFIWLENNVYNIIYNTCYFNGKTKDLKDYLYKLCNMNEKLQKVHIYLFIYFVLFE